MGRYSHAALRSLEMSAPHVEGFFDHEEGIFLHMLSSSLTQDSLAVEIGSFCGKSSRYLMVGTLLSKSRLVCIDPFDTTGMDFEKDRTDGDFTSGVNTIHELFDGNIRPVFNTTVYPYSHKGLTILRDLSQDAARKWHWGAIDLLFIDGNHFRARQDFEDFFPYFTPWTMVVFHDALTGPTESYGIDSPSNTVASLLNDKKGGWKPYGRVTRTLAITRTLDWWATRIGAAYDYLTFDLGRLGFRKVESAPGNAGSQDTVEDPIRGDTSGTDGASDGGGTQPNVPDEEAKESR